MDLPICNNGHSIETLDYNVLQIGAGSYPGGRYSLVCFQTPGQIQFLPGDGASPHIGEPGRVETVEEMRVETLCVGRQVMLAAVDALKKSVTLSLYFKALILCYQLPPI